MMLKKVLNTRFVERIFQLMRLKQLAICTNRNAWNLQLQCYHSLVFSKATYLLPYAGASFLRIIKTDCRDLLRWFSARSSVSA